MICSTQTSGVVNGMMFQPGIYYVFRSVLHDTVMPGPCDFGRTTSWWGAWSMRPHPEWQ